MSTRIGTLSTSDLKKLVGQIESEDKKATAALDKARNGKNAKALAEAQRTKHATEVRLRRASYELKRRTENFKVPPSFAVARDGAAPQPALKAAGHKGGHGKGKGKPAPKPVSVGATVNIKALRARRAGKGKKNGNGGSVTNDSPATPPSTR